MLSVYLAARYARLNELAGYRQTLERIGIVVTSDWLNGERRVEDANIGGWDASAIAIHDLEDIRRADALVAFTEPLRQPTRGGRHVEFGFAYALGKRIIVVGGAESVFYNLPDVLHVPDFAAATLVLIHWANS